MDPAQPERLVNRRLVIDRNRHSVGWVMRSVALPLALAIGILALLLGRSGIESDLETRSEAALADAFGAEAAALETNFDGRDGTVRGVAPNGVSQAEIGSVLGELDGVRRVDVQLVDTEPTTPTTVPATAAPSTSTPLDPDAAQEVTVTFDGTVVTLAGIVHARSEADELRALAETEVGLSNVITELTTVGEPTDASAARIDDLGSLFEIFNRGASDATLSLIDGQIMVTATAPDQRTAIALEAWLSSAATSVPVGVTIDAPGLSRAEEVTGLQSELDALAAQIAETVVFASGDATLPADAAATLDAVVLAMGSFALPVVEIQGHTDDRGDPEENVDLSQDRADAVLDYLTSNGVDPQRVQATGFGAAEPLADNDTADGRRQNRRVALVALETFEPGG